MHIRINQETLKTVIAKAITTTTAKLAVKSLNCFLLEAVDNKLTIKSTTLEVSSVITIPCEVIKKGVALLPAKALHDAVSACEKGDIVIKMNEAKQLSLTTSTSKIKLFTLPDVSDFPEFQTQGVDYVEIEPSLFVDTLQRTIGFSSSDETRYNLCGIHCNIDGGVVKFSATDGHRMSIIRRRFQSDLKMLNGVTIPRKLAQEIIAFIGEEKDEALQEIVKIGRKENKLFISIGSSLLFGNLLDETAIFPDVNQVTPKQSNIKHIINSDTKTIKQTLKRLYPFSTDKFFSINIGMSDNVLHLKATSPDTGEVEQEIAVESSSSTIETIACNLRYLAEAIGSLAGDELQISIVDKISPLLIKCKDDDSHIVIVMPMRL